ncbi:MAG: hypothetical protein H0T17_00270 [Propionibacteriales bacterium]|nr:hypothetical protein [Propionibacteriales bacterium]
MSSKCLIGAVVLAVLALAGCSGSESSATDDATTTPTRSAPTTLDDGTTAPGVDLSLGKTATVRFGGNSKHESVIDLTVTSVKKGKLSDFKGFDLDDKTKMSTIYYVHAKVKNVGKGDLSGRKLVLYGSVSNSLVVQPVEFGTTFKPCDYNPLPKPFKRSKKAAVCMVMLAPKKGKIKDVQWRPPNNAEPISWLLH